MSVENASNTCVTTQPAGNTKAAGRHYILTVNERSLPDYENIKDYLFHWKALNYFLCTEHIGSSNKHYHIYVQYRNVVRMDYTKLFGAHVEKSYGSPQQNVDYLYARDEKHASEHVTANLIEEYGELRRAGGRRIADVKKMQPEERDELDIQYYNIVKQINNEEACDIRVDDWHKDVEVVWITGESGAGKSQLAKEIMRNKKIETFNEVKHVNDFWIGVGGSSTCAVYDDFRDSHMKASEFINFIDYNVHCLNIKGSMRKNCYSTIIITSIQHPNDIYRNMPAEAREQWLRRMRIIDLHKFNSDDEQED